MFPLTKHPKYNKLILSIGISVISFGIGLLSIHEMVMSLSDPVFYFASFLFTAGAVMILSSLIDLAKYNHMSKFSGRVSL